MSTLRDANEIAAELHERHDAECRYCEKEIAAAILSAAEENARLRAALEEIAAAGTSKFAWSSLQAVARAALAAKAREGG